MDIYAFKIAVKQPELVNIEIPFNSLGSIMAGLREAAIFAEGYKGVCALRNVTSTNLTDMNILLQFTGR